MILQINLDGNNIKLTLKSGRKVIDEFSWTDEYSLSEKLLPNIDALLRKNKIDKNLPPHLINRCRCKLLNSKYIRCGGKIKKVTTKISQTSGVTSSRIVQTVAKAWNTAF